MRGSGPDRNGVEIGGMQWTVTPPDELREGRLLEMVSTQDFGSSPGYPMTDETTVIKTDDGEVHISVERQRRKETYTDRLTFEPGTLRAIIDHVEAVGVDTAQPARRPSRGWFERVFSWMPLPK